MTFVLVEPRIHLRIVDLLATFSDTLEQERFRVELRVYTEDIEDDSRRGSVVSGPDDVSVTNDKYEFPFVVIVQYGERVDGPLERLFAFGVTRYLANDKFVEQFRLSL